MLSEAEYQVLRERLYMDLQAQLCIWAVKRIGGAAVLIAAGFLHHAIRLFLEN